MLRLMVIVEWDDKSGWVRYEGIDRIIDKDWRD